MLNRDNNQDAYVTSHALEQQVLVKGLDRNRAVEGDVVAIELYSQDRWSLPSGQHVIL